MELVMPPLLMAIRELRWRIESGLSVREGLRQTCRQSDDAFFTSLSAWLLHTERAVKDENPLGKVGSSPLERVFFTILARGIQGQPILETLFTLEQEVQRKALAELDVHIARLPFKLMIPLFAFQFPAYLLLLLGPLLTEFTRSMGG